MCKECLKGDCECKMFKVYIGDIDFFPGIEFETENEAIEFLRIRLTNFLLINYKYNHVSISDKELKFMIKEIHVEK